ncbi:head-tail connector protein [Lacunimicrobium album]
MPTNIIEVSTSPIFEVEQIKQALTIEYDHDDNLIETYIIAVTDHIEQLTGRHFSVTTYCLYLESFPPRFKNIELPAPLDSVDSIKYWKNGELVTMTTDQYQVLKLWKMPSLVFPINGNWQTELDQRPDAVQIEYTVGTLAMDASIFPLIVLMVKVLYDNPEGKSQKDLLTAFDRLVAPHFGGSGI